MEETLGKMGISMKSKRFLQVIDEHFSKKEGTYLHDVCIDDHRVKVSSSSLAYAPWLEKMLGFLTGKYSLEGKNVLDVGCGTGELTVWMKLLGYNAKGVDVNNETLNMGRVLAKENGLNEELFINNPDGKLPFDDKSIDVITLFSVLEHISDEVLALLIPELKRVCRGVVYILVPNRLSPSDDHTGLWFVPWMPRKMALFYIRMRGGKYKYHISLSGEWDVYYRSWNRIKSLFGKDFALEFPDDDVIFPTLEMAPSLSFFGKRFQIGKHSFRIGIPIPVRLIESIFGYPTRAFYRYLNFLLIPRD
ncbi:class I SAM-dependent methyltransferase [bacterium]|nr:class I SAM-dependent methyltransferase [bacterium]